jgi:hypothetical protein
VANLKIVIDGDTYEIPLLASLNMTESMLFYEYTKVSPLEMEDLTPPALGALLHIGIQRTKPQLRDKAIRALIGELNMQELFLQLMEAFQAANEEAEKKEEEEERPPTSPTPPGNEPESGDVGNESASQQSSAPPSNGSSDHSPDLSDLSPTGAPV